MMKIPQIETQIAGSTAFNWFEVVFWPSTVELFEAFLIKGE